MGGILTWLGSWCVGALGKKYRASARTVRHLKRTSVRSARLYQRTLNRELKRRDAEIARLNELLRLERRRRETVEMQWRDKLLETVGRMGFSHMESPYMTHIASLESQPEPQVSYQYDAKRGQVIATEKTGFTDGVREGDDLSLDERVALEEMYRNHLLMGEREGVSESQARAIWEEHYDEMLQDVRA